MKFVGEPGLFWKMGAWKNFHRNVDKVHRDVDKVVSGSSNLANYSSLYHTFSNMFILLLIQFPSAQIKLLL